MSAETDAEDDEDDDGSGEGADGQQLPVVGEEGGGAGSRRAWRGLLAALSARPDFVALLRNAPEIQGINKLRGHYYFSYVFRTHLKFPLFKLMNNRCSLGRAQLKKKTVHASLRTTILGYRDQTSYVCLRICLTPELTCSCL